MVCVTEAQFAEIKHLIPSVEVAEIGSTPCHLCQIPLVVTVNQGMDFAEMVCVCQPCSAVVQLMQQLMGIPPLPDYVTRTGVRMAAQALGKAEADIRADLAGRGFTVDEKR
jgi:hypothetical protein